MSGAGPPDALPFSKERLLTARQALHMAAPLLARRPILIVSDFDGTLSQIVQDPWGARILPLAQRALRRLAVLPGVHVCLLSGRTASDLATRTRIGGVAYLGNHGIERGRLRRRQRPGTLQVQVDPSLASFDPLVDDLARGVARLVAEPWLVVERKVPSVAFHFRAAPDVAAAARRVTAAVERLDPERVFVRFPGRRVLELRPPGVVAKGEAMRLLLDETRPSVAFVLGDDMSDAQAFETLTRARAAGEVEGLALAVQARAEAPPEVAASADLVLSAPREAARFLAGLEARLRDASVSGSESDSAGQGGLDPADGVAQRP